MSSLKSHKGNSNSVRGCHYEMCSNVGECCIQWVLSNHGKPKDFTFSISEDRMSLTQHEWKNNLPSA